MSPNRFQLEGPSLDELNARILAEHGPHAKVVAVKAVTSGGIQGFFAQRRYEVEVDVPDGTARDAHSFDLPARAGIAQLLADTEDEEARAHLVDAIPKLSTNSVDFDAIMADLTYNTAQIVPVLDGPTVFRQAPLAGAGDLVVVIGLGNDPLEVARDMSAAAGTRSLSVVGAVTDDGLFRLTNRRGALAARAAGVREDHSVFVALGIPRAGLDDDSVFALHFLQADQVWVAVDAGRKPEDTARWVTAVQAAVHVDAIAVIGSDSTTTPKTVHELGIQVGWVESGSIG
ncbi:hypothetical protein [Glaciihabitans sp. UYNi722]|uniref:hypothetical protein n=1 Tax=Glaciihabitans sp. UYNi722 TaxID=3156344 RepID=UPI0033914DCA